MGRRVLGPAFRGVILDREPAAREARAQKARAVRVELARGIDGRDADQVGGEGHHLVGESVDLL